MMEQPQEAIKDLDQTDLEVMARRSFMIQALWNFEKMQSLGWAWTVQPALRKFYPDRQARLEALKRHMEFFNTHPYVAGPILGTAMRTERDALLKGENPGPAVAAVRLGMMGPLAALGDVFFWATLRPLAALAAVGVFFMGGAQSVAAVAAALTLLLVFNVPHLLARFRGPALGYERGSEMINLLRQVDVPRSVARAHRVGLVILAAVVAGVGRFRFPGGEDHPLGDNLLYLGTGALLLAALRMRIGVMKILVLLLAASLMAASLETVTQMSPP